MILRVMIVLWLAAALVAAALLYRTSYQVQALEAQLRAVNGQILLEQETIELLRADWVLLTNPTRLRALAVDLTELGPITADQMLDDVAGLPQPLKRGGPDLAAAYPPLPPPNPRREVTP